MLRIFTIVFFTIIFATGHAFSFDLDMTVDDDIRKNYNSSKLVKETEELPVLPEKLKNEKTYSATKENILQRTPTYTGNIKISKGTTFEVVNIGQISDWQQKGTIVKFKTNKPINKKKYSIPIGTIFTGEVVESHQPQITCNGGLVAIKIISMQYKGNTVPINAYITRANDKIIFLNNIKGERTYLKTVWAKGNWGRNLFNRMLTLTINLGKDTSTLILSPIPFIYGSICLGTNALTSPISAFFAKGKHISIPAGKNFKIKLTDEAFID